MAGLTTYGLGLGLAPSLPNGTTRYLALLTTLPTSVDGTGAVEASGSGYARAGHSAWTATTIDGVSYRRNNGTIEWPELTGALDGVAGWGIYTDSSGGSLIAYGPVQDITGADTTRNLAATDMPRLLDQELNVATTDAYSEIDVVNELSLNAFMALLPPGLAWPRDADAELTKLSRALAYEYSRIDKRGLDLLEEVDPRTTIEMIDDWERVFGLPDECDQPDTLAGRRVALQGKMVGHLDPSIANIISIAASVGYTINIYENRRADLFTCESECDDVLQTYESMFVWTVTTPSGETDAQLECVLDSLTPLHTVLVMVFHYLWPSMIYFTAGAAYVTVSAPMTAPLDGRRPGASLDSNWIGIGWSPDINQNVLIGSPGTYCLAIP